MKVLIITGGSLCRNAAAVIKEYGPELVIAADYGIHHALQLGIRPDLILGDFDSIDPAELTRCEGIERMTFPPEKDYTDTELALETAIEKMEGIEGSIMLLAAMGTRADHSLANVFLLKRTADLGIACEIVDDYNRIRMLHGPVQYTVAAGYPNISLLPMFGDAVGVTLEGFYYPLTDTTIPSGRAWGVSNELVEPEGRITLRDGYVLLIQSSDSARV
jgi:thiamine pyrophosphokinase